MAEQVLLLENIGTSVLVGPEQLPSLHCLLLTAASTLQMAPPDLYIKQVRTQVVSAVERMHIWAMFTALAGLMCQKCTLHGMESAKPQSLQSWTKLYNLHILYRLLQV